MVVGQALEAEGNMREAEKHYTDAKDWKAAVQMYRSHVSACLQKKGAAVNGWCFGAAHRYARYSKGCHGLRLQLRHRF